MYNDYKNLAVGFVGCPNCGSMNYKTVVQGSTVVSIKCSNPYCSLHHK